MLMHYLSTAFGLDFIGLLLFLEEIFSKLFYVIGS